MSSVEAGAAGNGVDAAPAVAADSAAAEVATKKARLDDAGASATTASESVPAAAAPPVDPELVKKLQAGEVVKVNRTEVLAKPEVIKERAKKLPRGYVFEPVLPGAVAEPTKEEEVSGKRSRKPTSRFAIEQQLAEEAKPRRVSKTPRQKARRATTGGAAAGYDVIGGGAAAAVVGEKRGRDDDVDVMDAEGGDDQDEIERMRQKKLEQRNRLLASLNTLENQLETIDQLAVLDGKPVPKRSKKTGRRSGAVTPKAARRSAAAASDQGDDVFYPPASTSSGRKPKPKTKFEPAAVARLTPELRRALQLLTQVMKHKLSWPFNKPVDPIALGIPDYPDVIKNPMDLGTVKARILAGDYVDVKEVLEDIKLVWTNCYTYNPPGTDVYVMAQKIQELWESKAVELTVEHREQRETDARLAELARAKRELEMKVAQLEQQRKVSEHQAAVQSGTLTPAPVMHETIPAPPQPTRPRATPKSRPRNSAAAHMNRPLTFEEKRDLSISINNLPADKLGRVVTIIQRSMPSLAESNPTELEIDIDSLDTRTLRALAAYCDSVLNPNAAPYDENDWEYQPGGGAAGGGGGGGSSSKKKKKKRPSPTDVIQTVTGMAETETQRRIREVEAGIAATQSTIQQLESSKPDGAASGAEDAAPSDKDGNGTPAAPAADAAAPAAAAADAAEAVKPGDEKPAKDGSDSETSSESEGEEDSRPSLGDALDAAPAAGGSDSKPSILPASASETQQVTLANADKWSNALSTPTSPSRDTAAAASSSGGGAAGGGDKAMWSEFKRKDVERERREEERKQQAEVIRKQLEAAEAKKRAEEQRRAEEAKRAEDEAKKRAEEEAEAERKRIEAERAAAKAERDSMAKTVDIEEQRRSMASFESEMGSGGNAALLASLHKPAAAKASTDNTSPDGG